MINKTCSSQKRLAEMMSALSISQSDIVKRTGIPKSSLSNYLSGKRTPKQDQLSLIADPYGINPVWLMGYDVPMYVTELPHVIDSSDYFEFDSNNSDLITGFSPMEIEIILAFRRADKVTQDNICKLLDVKRDSLLSKEAN